MERVRAGDAETRSADVVAGNVEQLKALFPDAFAEGEIDFEVLRQLLGGAVGEREERYGLSWHGKRGARRIALTPSAGTLRPRPEESVDWDTTRNLMIEGDNLEVLKLLQKSYAGRVKLIYIDPPYNTGKDFIYPDDFRDGVKNYLELTGQSDGEARVSSVSETAGRFHTQWLNMIYPRLRLARSLMRQDGFFVASIDDAELVHLREVLDEIFGEENHLATLVVDRNRKNDARFFSVGHEYMVVYARSKDFLTAGGVRLREAKEGVDEVREEFRRLRDRHGADWDTIAKGMRDYYGTFAKDDPRLPLARFTKFDEKGPYRQDGDPGWPGGGGPRYEVLHPGTGRPCRIPKSGWRYPTSERFWEEVDRGRIVFGRDETTVPSVRRNLFESDDQVMRSVMFSYAQTASNRFSDIFDGERVFDNPKSYADMARLVSYLTRPDDLVLDFFAGSGSTAHGVVLANMKDGGSRRFLLVQLPEPLDSRADTAAVAVAYLRRQQKKSNIAELTKERLRRSMAFERGRDPAFRGDLGFRVLSLSASNIRPWSPSPGDLEQELLEAVESVLPGRSEQDVLYELLLHLGLDLCVPIETRTIGGKDVHAVGGGVLFACLPGEITPADAEAVAHGIIAWYQELDPTGETKVYFRDSAFTSDEAKTNAVAVLEQYSEPESRPESQVRMIVRSL